MKCTRVAHLEVSVCIAKVTKPAISTEPVAIADSTAKAKGGASSSVAHAKCVLYDLLLMNRS